MISNNIYIAIGIFVGVFLTLAFFFVKSKFFVKKLAPVSDVKSKLRECSKNLKEANDVIRDLYSFFSDLENRGL